MAISVDNTITVGATGSGSLTLASTANLLIAYATQFGNTTPPSITYGGQAMTYSGTSGQQSSLNAFCLYLLNPPTGSNSFSTTFGGGGNSVSLTSYIGAPGGIEVTNPQLYASNQHPNPQLTTLTNNDWVVVGWYTDNSVSSITNGTIRGTPTNGGGMADSNAAITPAGSFTQTFNLGGAGNTALYQIAISPSSGVVTKGFMTTNSKFWGG